MVFMKVLFCIRPNYLKNIAGDSVQLLTITKYLRSKGVDIYINNGKIKDYSEYDIIHLFNLTRITETYEYYKIAKKCKKPIVITPIYWNLEKYYLYSKSEIHLAMWNGNKIIRNEIISGCDMIYPSSIKEMELMQNEFGFDNAYIVVYNCIDVYDFNIQLKLECDFNKPFILCVARVCPRKNQFALASICEELGETLILAGEANNEEYLKKCLSFKNVVHTGHLDKSSLLKLYQNARLHILCSFVETPGLSSLEAGAYGCNIISTKEGSTEEYFSNMALYCNPYDEGDIYNSIKLGLEFNKQPQLQKHIVDNFNSEKCLKPLYESYFKL
jgi:glycosyltransferase involved in cell wall biosynthesis